MVLGVSVLPFLQKRHKEIYSHTMTVYLGGVSLVFQDPKVQGGQSPAFQCLFNILHIPPDDTKLQYHKAQ